MPLRTPPANYVRLGEDGAAQMRRGINVWFKHQSLWRVAKILSIAESKKSIKVNFQPLNNRLNVCRDIRIQPIDKGKTIREAVIDVLKNNSIKTRTDLDKWCDRHARKKLSREKLYKKVETLCPDKWREAKEPKASVRATYHSHLIGFGKH